MDGYVEYGKNIQKMGVDFWKSKAYAHNEHPNKMLQQNLNQQYACSP